MSKLERIIAICEEQIRQGNGDMSITSLYLQTLNELKIQEIIKNVE